MLSMYGNCTRLLKVKNKLRIGCFFTNKVEKNSRYFVGVCNKTIILLARLVGCEMVNNCQVSLGGSLYVAHLPLP